MGTSPFAATAKLPKQSLSAEERVCRLEEAKAYLRHQVTAQPLPARVLINNAKAAGIASRTLHRAKDALGVQVQGQGWGHGGQWLWAAPSRLEPGGTASVVAVGGAPQRTS